ncbi:MAG TPA: gluconate 2-dehydrogenase subunit 3 family protein [Verrucomicrobiae bacterium]|nr:gluconate 2-dehydrogenase subunit 3 family protein [Verrucomicrobiae bacterium]
MKNVNSARRDFLLQIGGAAGAAWITAQWPGMVAAAQHAHAAARANPSPAFEVLTPEQAIEVEAVSSLIIPTDELPGAREAGAVYFIDRALKTFAADAKPVYAQGLAELNRMTSEMFPGLERFSVATPDQQEKVFAKLEEESQAGRGATGRSFTSSGMSFAETVWFHTLAGFLVDPEGGGNRDYVGWNVIGRDPAHSFSPPFGFYDKDYPGWKPAAPEVEKK